MEFQRKPHRDERRRRVLMDESLTQSGEDGLGGGEVSGDSGAPAAAGVRLYAHGALAENQLRICDLLPQRRWAVACMQLLVVSAYAAVFAAFGYLFVLVPVHDRGAWRAFDLTSPHNLASWLNSTTLLVCSLLCFFIYSIRRYRADDYRGRYGVWRWFGGISLLGSIDATAGLHHSLLAALRLVGTTEVIAPGPWCWMLFYAALVLIRIDRLVFEIRSNRFVTGWTLFAVISYSLAAATRLQAWETRGLFHDWLWQSASVCGHLGMLFALQLYARHVFFEAQGVLQQQAEQKQRRQHQKREKQQQRQDARSARTQSATEAAEAKAEAKRARRRKRNDLTPTAVTEACEPSQNPPAPTTGSEGAAPDRPDRAPKKKRTDKPPAAASQKSARVAEPAEAPDAANGSSDDDSQGDTSQLSKAERRRLRKMKRKNRQAA